MDKYKNLYRVSSARLPNWDYSSEASYFVTICTKDREEYFGEVISSEMNLSQIGRIAEKCWVEIPGHFPFVCLDLFVVMPNHIHGIIVFNGLETQDLASLQVDNNKVHNTFGPQSMNLGSVVRGFKIGVKAETKKCGNNFYWQSRFYDHIIRDEVSLNNIREYITNNPKKWELDEYNKKYH